MTTTTLAHALSASDQSITLVDPEDLASGQLLALDAEYCRVLRALTATQALVQRGVNGTPSAPHQAGVTVSIDVPEGFLTGPQALPAFGIDTNVLTGLGPSDAATFQPATGGAPSNATYVTLSTNASLTNERVLTAGANITLTDGGPGSTITIDATGGGTPASPDTSVQFNDSGAFGGSSNFTWDGLSLSVVSPFTTNVQHASILTTFSIDSTAGAITQSTFGLQLEGNTIGSNSIGSVNLFDGDLNTAGTGPVFSLSALVFGVVNASHSSVGGEISGIELFLENDTGTVPDMYTYQSRIFVTGGTVGTVRDIWLNTLTTSGATVGDVQRIAIDDIASITVTGVKQAINYADKFIVDSAGAITVQGHALSFSGNLTTTGAFNPTFAIPSSSTWTFPSGGGTLSTTTGTVTSIATTSPISGGTITGTGTISLLVNTDFNWTAGQTITAPAGAKALTLAGGTQTTSFPALDITQTWNAAATFTGIKAAFTTTSSNSGSLVFDLQAGTSPATIFNVRKDGNTTIKGSANNSINLGGTSNLLMDFVANGNIGLRFRGDDTGSSGPALIQLGSGGTITWQSAIGLQSGSVDLIIGRDAANTLALRNSTAAQRVNVYNTFTTFATAGEWWKLDWQGTANQFRMGAVAGSSSGTNLAASWDYGDKLASATAAITVPATSGNIVFGGGVQLSNAATTGLVAGVLAASTNASIVLYDSGGQAYRIPCII